MSDNRRYVENLDLREPAASEKIFLPDASLPEFQSVAHEISCLRTKFVGQSTDDVTFPHSCEAVNDHFNFTS